MGTPEGSGGNTRYAGVGWIISMRLDVKPTPVTFLQVYMPTSTNEDDIMVVGYMKNYKALLH